MTKVTLIPTLLALSLTLCACGGSALVASPFQGTFAGPWTSTGAHSGTAHLVVSAGGGVTGSETDNTTSTQGSLTGALLSNGIFTGTVTVPGHSAITTSGQFQISSDSNTLSGTVVYGGDTYTYTLTRQ